MFPVFAARDDLEALRRRPDVELTGGKKRAKPA